LRTDSALAILRLNEGLPRFGSDFRIDGDLTPSLLRKQAI
jgi:hypothetical protein